jgi:hypothetical protein
MYGWSPVTYDEWPDVLFGAPVLRMRVTVHEAPKLREAEVYVALRNVQHDEAWKYAARRRLFAAFD